MAHVLLSIESTKTRQKISASRLNWLPIGAERRDEKEKKT